MVATGLAARFGLSGAAADAAGGALYTVMAYLVIAFLRPRWRPARVGLAALVFSAAVELFQLTPVPAELGEQFAPLKLLLGSTFVATDLLAYAAGAALAAAADAGLRRRGSGA